MTNYTSNKQYAVTASYLVLRKQDQVLLLRRYQTGYEDGNYSMVAGHVEPHETFTQCLIRETAEEIGITLDPAAIQIAHIMHRNTHAAQDNIRLDAFFLATTWQGEIINQEPHKCDDLSWFTLDALPANTIPYIRQALTKITQGIFYSEYATID